MPTTQQQRFALATIFSAGLLFSPVSTWANGVNLNVSDAYDINNALPEVNLELAMQIYLHCETYTCRQPEDLLGLPGMTPELLNTIKGRLYFDVMQRGMDLNNDC